MTSLAIISASHAAPGAVGPTAQHSPPPWALRVRSSLARVTSSEAAGRFGHLVKCALRHIVKNAHLGPVSSVSLVWPVCWARPLSAEATSGVHRAPLRRAGRARSLESFQGNPLENAVRVDSAR